MPMLQSILETQGTTTNPLLTSKQESQPLEVGFSTLLMDYQQAGQRAQTDATPLLAEGFKGNVISFSDQQGGENDLSSLLGELVASLQSMMEALHSEDEAAKTPSAEPFDFNEQEAQAFAVKQLSEVLTNVEAILSQLDLHASEQPTAQTLGSELDAANFVSKNMPGEEQEALTEDEQKVFLGLGKQLAQVLMQLQSVMQAGHETQDALLPSEHIKASSQQPLKNLLQAGGDFDRQNQSQLTTENKLPDETETGLRLASERALSKESMAHLREKLQKIKHLVKQMVAHQPSGAVLGQKELATQMKMMQQATHALNAMTEPQASVADTGINSAIMSVFQPLSALWGTAKNNLEKVGLKIDGHFQFQKVSSQPVVETETRLTDDAGDQASPQNGQGSPTAQILSAKGGLMQPSVMQTTLALPVRHPQWGDQLAQRVLFLAQNSQQLAQIRLHPAHLGPIQVKMKLEQDQSVQVSLHAHHALTREAIEQAVPRLRELFAQQGLSLGEIQVQADAEGHAQAFAQMRRAQQHTAGAESGHANNGVEEASTYVLSHVQQQGLIDHFV